MNRRLRSGCLALAIVVLAAPAPADESATEIPASGLTDAIGDGGLLLGDATGGVIDFDERQRLTDNFVVAPVPGRSPPFGWSLALASAYFLDAPDGQKPSVLGGFGWYSENDSYAFGAGGNLHLDDDRLRVKFGAAYLDVRYRFYGIGSDNDRGISIDILQEAPVYFTTATYRLWRQLYIGLGYLGGSVETRVDFAIEDPGGFFDPSLDLDIGAAMIPFAYDTRDHEYFPRSGWLVDGRVAWYREGVGSDFDANTFQIAANRYLTFGDDDVLALRGYFRTTGGDAPFFLLSTFGGNTDLRGYPSGRYRDRMMYSLQAEYRWQVNERWIVTGFAGFGEVAPELDEFGRDLLPAAGVGARLVLSKKQKVSLSFDIAQGRDGTEYYFGVGEAF